MAIKQLFLVKKNIVLTTILFILSQMVNARNWNINEQEQMIQCIIPDFDAPLKFTEDAAFYYLQRSQQYAEAGNKEMAYTMFQQYRLLKDSLFQIAKHAAIEKLSMDVAALSKDKQLANKQTLIAHNKVLVDKKAGLVVGLVISILCLLVLCLLSLKAYLGKRNLMKKAREQWKHEAELLMLNANFQGEHKERGKIAQQLQDSIAPLLHDVQTKLLSLEITYKGIAQTISFEETKKIVDDALEELNDISSSLATAGIHSLGLIQATNFFVQNIARNNKFALSLDVEGHATNLSSEKEVAIYRIIQELVQNVIKHAKASAAKIHLCFNTKETIITVSDNGKGFNPSAAQEGMGWKNIKDRLLYIQGSYAVMNEKGTTITIKIPSLFTKASFN